MIKNHNFQMGTDRIELYERPYESKSAWNKVAVYLCDGKWQPPFDVPEDVK